MSTKKTVAIVQARMNSTRLPGKVLKNILDIPMIEIIIKRLQKCKLLDDIIIATTVNKEDDILEDMIHSLGINIFRGNEKDVLERYINAAKVIKADIIVRITADCPLIDPTLIDDGISLFLNGTADYLSNKINPTYPDGLDFEIFTFSALLESSKLTSKKYDREHVTPYLRESGIFKVQSFENDSNHSEKRWTVDEIEDLHVVENVYNYFKPNIYFGWTDIIELQNNKPNLFLENIFIQRDSGAHMSSSQKLWRRAKKVIPGGGMLLSKRPEMFLPDIWPAYFSKSKGCFVWDLDDNKYIDMSLMGIGTNILGYAHDEIDNTIKDVINKGNLTTLNCPEEVYLAEKLIEMHPWAGMVRFARTGGEACAIAVRIARSFTKRNKIAICGYHGWHDWYLSTNLSDGTNLSSHLLPGLSTVGVPNELAGLTIPFEYNNIESLNKIIKSNDIGVIVMEVSRNFDPSNNFLESVRKICDKNEIVLVFDECTSGFRETFGGLHLKFNVIPDILIFGKALGNGYAITSVLGKKDIMNNSQNTFISSTFWTERIGPSAALKTLEIMERENSWTYISKTGNEVKRRWNLLAEKYDLEIQHFGLSALAGFTFKSKNALAYKTYITQEMLEKGFLASNAIYFSIEHKPEIIDEYFFNLEVIFKQIKICEEGSDIYKLLKTRVCDTTFSRLN